MVSSSQEASGRTIDIDLLDHLLRNFSVIYQVQCNNQFPQRLIFGFKISLPIWKLVPEALRPRGWSWLRRGLSVRLVDASTRATTSLLWLGGWIQ